ncbi:MAG: DUF192 domain-containing protein [Steroidobacteraceae bacterium]
MTRPVEFRLRLWLALLLAIAPIVRADAPQLELASFPRETLQILTAGGSHEFRVWIADTRERQLQGLMFVRDLPATQGMLFVYDRPQLISMWMKNTYVPLDMLFFDGKGRLVDIAANTTPHSLTTIRSRRPATLVLEVRAGVAAKLKLRVGDRLQRTSTVRP